MCSIYFSVLKFTCGKSRKTKRAKYPGFYIFIVPIPYCCCLEHSDANKIRFRLENSGHMRFKIKFVSCKRSRLQQKTSFPQNAIQTRPHVTEFAFWSSQQANRLNDQPIYECQTELCIHKHS